MAQASASIQKVLEIFRRMVIGALAGAAFVLLYIIFTLISESSEISGSIFWAFIGGGAAFGSVFTVFGPLVLRENHSYSALCILCAISGAIAGLIGWLIADTEASFFAPVGGGAACGLALALGERQLINNRTGEESKKRKKRKKKKRKK